MWRRQARSTARDRASARGQSVVELALIMPVIILLFMGIIDFSRLYHAYVAATNAARVGAEVGMPYDRTNDAIAAAVRDEASPTLGITNIVISPTVRSGAGSVEVRVTYVFTAFTPMVSNFWGGGPLPLVASATARVY